MGGGKKTPKTDRFVSPRGRLVCRHHHHHLPSHVASHTSHSLLAVYAKPSQGFVFNYHRQRHCTSKTRRASRTMSRSSSSSGAAAGWKAVLANEHLLRQIFTYVGPRQYRFVAGVNHQWKQVYGEVHSSDYATSRKIAISSKRALHIFCQEDEFRGHKTNRWSGDLVARQGDLGSLQWLRARHWKRAMHSVSSVGVCTEAARGGHLKMLKWARANGCNWNSCTCRDAASGGHLEVLKWARANGCGWNDETCYMAAAKGHFEILKWARYNGLSLIHI